MKHEVHAGIGFAKAHFRQHARRRARDIFETNDAATLREFGAKMFALFALRATVFLRPVKVRVRQ
jgi:hypothetical protein